MIDNNLTVNAFVDDHSPQKDFKPICEKEKGIDWIAGNIL